MDIVLQVAGLTTDSTVVYSVRDFGVRTGGSLRTNVITTAKAYDCS